MFTGGNSRPSNVKIMQIFYEVKQQFPSIPDHLVTSLVSSYVQQNSTLSDLIGVLKEVAANQDQQMGRSLKELDTTPLALSPVVENTAESVGKVIQTESDNIVANNAMDQSVSDINQNVIKKSDSAAKRPDTLDIQSDKTSFDKDRRLRPSEKCTDLYKLLNSPNLNEKPPRSPLSAKRATPSVLKQSPTTSKETPKKETVSTPTQTTDTLINNCVAPSVNLSLNVNCQMGVVQSPVKPKSTTRLEVTPTQPWLNPASWFQPGNPDVTSPRSFTSVNLTLRPPSSAPQHPIDITSQNSNLTYSTSSFDPHRGLQSRLQITVGPGGSGSVSSVRSRPRSSYVPMESNGGDIVAARAGSLNNLAAVNPESATVMKQQARVERMRIELQTGYAKLVIMRQEVDSLEKMKQQSEKRASAEVEKQLQMEIKHLRFQCEQLAMADKGPSLTPIRPAPPPPQQPPVVRRQTRGRLYYQGPPLGLPEMEGPKWNCSLCTFLNHPDLDKCEQCEMPRVLHGRSSNPNAVNINLDALKNIPAAATNPNVNFDLLSNNGLLVPNNSDIFINVAGSSSAASATTNTDVTVDMLRQSAKYLKNFRNSNGNSNPNVTLHERSLSQSSAGFANSRVCESFQRTGFLDDQDNTPTESNPNSFPLVSSVSAPSLYKYTLNAHEGQA
ncbi:uncharacterized protein LOC132699123 isoform X2 [Cylas formicarius]|uniref:uncharacterized protein LOC132699123 isoform X2 n=1 Tax=Cylas formicarius TaxID=197179 RepID=UPI002958BFD4|nr:uncharacterized protein LOC132699123 isoform X2 [Cylas formicarius]